MAKVEIYTTNYCGYCVRAKQFLDQKGIAYAEISLEAEPERREEMLKRSGGKRTVPQIFINDESIGGFEELWALNQSGGLKDLLQKDESL